MTVQVRFSKPTLTGYHDLKVSFQLDIGGRFKHICELEFTARHQSKLWIKSLIRTHYEYFRKYFTGGSGDSLEEQPEDVKMICGEITTELNDSLLNNILKKDENEERLNHLENLFSGTIV